jgi:hypothetical protein
VFVVQLVSSEASERCGLKAGEYTLVVAPAELQLRLDHLTLLTWPYRYDHYHITILISNQQAPVSPYENPSVGSIPLTNNSFSLN